MHTNTHKHTRVCIHAYICIHTQVLWSLDAASTARLRGYEAAEAARHSKCERGNAGKSFGGGGGGIAQFEGTI